MPSDFIGFWMKISVILQPKKMCLYMSSEHIFFSVNMGFFKCQELWRTWGKTMGNCTTSVTYHPWNKRTKNVELRTCVLLALERASLRAWVRLFFWCVSSFWCFSGREVEVLRDGEEEEEQELEDGVGVGFRWSAHTAQGGRSACQVQVHAGTRQDPTHSQPW